MSTATITGPSNRRATKIESPIRDVEHPRRRCGGGTRACENCRLKRKRKSAKKKPFKRSKGTWRGAFRGTLDF